MQHTASLHDLLNTNYITTSLHLKFVYSTLINNFYWYYGTELGLQKAFTVVGATIHPLSCIQIYHTVQKPTPGSKTEQRLQNSHRALGSTHLLISSLQLDGLQVFRNQSTIQVERIIPLSEIFSEIPLFRSLHITFRSSHFHDLKVAT